MSEIARRIAAVAAPILWRFASAGPPVLYGLGIVGVPVAVLFLTGGPSTFFFWVWALIWIPVIVIFGFFPLGLLALIVLLPLAFIVEKLSRGRFTSEVVAPPFWFVAWGILFVRNAELPVTENLSLPTSNENLGVLIVLASALVASWLLLLAGEHVKHWIDRSRPRPRTSWTPPTTTLEPATPESTPLIGWRAWKWQSGALRGVMASWESSTFIAECDSCDEIPGWGDRCGVYAVKEIEFVPRFDPPVVIGKVELAGLVIEHDAGYRASHVTITDLWVDDPTVGVEVADRYPDVRVHLGHPVTTEGATK